jgi:flagellar biosynthesis chaperone FliJ
MNEEQIEKAIQTFKNLKHIYRQIETSPGYSTLLEILKEGEKYYREESVNAERKYNLEVQSKDFISMLDMTIHEDIERLKESFKLVEEAREKWTFFYSKYKEIH